MTSFSCFYPEGTVRRITNDLSNYVGISISLMERQPLLDKVR
jgi:hypothetical protein